MARALRVALVLVSWTSVTGCPPPDPGNTPEVIVERLPVPLRAQLGDEPVWKLAVASDGSLIASAGRELRHFRLALGDQAWQPFTVPDGFTLLRGTIDGALYFQSELGWSVYLDGRFLQSPAPTCRERVGADLVTRGLTFLDFGPNDVAWFNCASEAFLARYDPHADAWARFPARVDLSNEGLVSVLSDERLLLSGNVPQAAVLELTDAGVVERLTGSTCAGAECLQCPRPGLGGRLGAFRLTTAPMTLLSTGRGALTGLPNGSLVPTNVSPAVGDDEVVAMASVALDGDLRLWASLRHGNNDEYDVGRVYRLLPNRQDWVKVFESDTHLRPELVASSKLEGVIAWDGNPRESPRGDPPRTGIFRLKLVPGAAPMTWPTAEGPPTPPLTATGAGWWAMRGSLSRPDGGGLDVQHQVVARQVDGGLVLVGAGDGDDPLTVVTLDNAGTLGPSWARRRTSSFPLGLVESGPPRVDRGTLLVPWNDVNLAAQTQGALTFDRFSLDGTLVDSLRFRTGFNVGGNVAVAVADDGATWWLAGRAVGRVDADGGFALQVSSPSRDAVVPQDVVALPSGDAVYTAAGSLLGMVTVFRVGANRQVRWARDVWVGEGAMTNTNGNVASNLGVSSSGEVVLCVGTRHAETPLGALVRLSPDGQTASARAFRAFLATRTECGFIALRGVRLARTDRGFVCSFDRRARPEEQRPLPGVRAEFPDTGALTVTSARGADGVTLDDGTPVSLDGVKADFTLVHAVGARACELPSDVLDLGAVPVTLRSVTLNAAAGTLAPLDGGAPPLDAPFVLDGGAVVCD